MSAKRDAHAEALAEVLAASCSARPELPPGVLSFSRRINDAQKAEIMRKWMQHRVAHKLMWLGAGVKFRAGVVSTGDPETTHG